MKGNRSICFNIILVLSTMLVLTACGSDSETPSGSNPTSASYRVTLTNITHSQPLSPMAVVLHGDTYSAWEVGTSASPALEVLAEDGSPVDLIQAADTVPQVLATGTGTGLLLPGTTESVDLIVSTADRVNLTVVTMLVNTNDAFGGLNGQSLDQLAVGQSAIFMAPTYDAGTEANSESAATIPGPAAGGEGFNVVRDDMDFVRIHPGVISDQDGLTGSALSGDHRWDNPVFKLVVTRTS